MDSWAPDERLAGTMKFSPLTGVSLAILIGSFEPDNRTNYDAIHERIVGLCADVGRITILKCYGAGREVRTYIGREDIVSSRYVSTTAVIGNHLDFGITFTRVTVSFYPPPRMVSWPRPSFD